MSKLSDFLSKSKIDSRRLIATSKRVEGLRLEDRRIKQAKKLAKQPDASDAVKELAGKSRRSGRAVSAPTLNAALRGDKVSPVARKRITRAVNAILAQKKQSEVSSADLF